ncbi:MAG TPA: cytochrome c peroxidase [Kofleriaceae bacterium]|nr:cytochrome c peroxidase [Kofleriaceae bacterium]
MNTRLCFCLSLAALAACGGDDDGGAPDGAPAADAQPDAQTVYDYCADAPADFDPPDPGVRYNMSAPDFVVTYPAENPYSWDKAILGKILFWEEQLSSDDTVACGTCHRAGAGGSDPRAGTDVTFPSAIGGIHGAMGIRACTIDENGEVVYTNQDSAVQVTKRKPPTYLDAMFAADLFWDGRALTQFTDPDTGEVAIASGGGLESQVVGPPLNSTEMACAGRTWPDIHAKLATARPLVKARDIPPDMLFALCARPSYPELFEAAFGDPAITTRRIAFAIATHERTLISNQTPYDRFQDGDATAMTAQQQSGMDLFAAKGRCQRCHVPPLFASGQFVNLGLINFDNPGGDVGSDAPHVDLGREEHTGLEADRGKFRTPTARNVALREAQGILHDGIGDGASLEELMAAYNTPPKRDAHTDPRMDPAIEGNVLGLTGEEIAAINAFMREALTDPRVAAEQYPFDRPKLGTEP